MIRFALIVASVLGFALTAALGNLMVPLLRELVAEGAIDGIEVHHPRNSPEDRTECAELCKKHDLIVTGGSDFHGANHGKPHPVGACVTEDDQIARIEALARKRRGIEV